MFGRIERFIKNFGRKTYTVNIVYKSGHVQTVRCTGIHVQYEYATGKVIELNIEGADKTFAFAGISNIESIWRK